MAGEVTQLLSLLVGGDGGAVDRLMPLVYADLHALAAAYLREERPGHTLQPTALVHETYLRLVDQRATDWKDRNHFFAIASRAMRRVLVDHARGRGRLKRGGAARPQLGIDAIEVFAGGSPEDILAVDDALTRLETIDPQGVRIVEMRCFGGLTLIQIAGVLGLSESTVARQWRVARAWLRCELSGERAGKDSADDHEP